MGYIPVKKIIELQEPIGTYNFTFQIWKTTNNSTSEKKSEVNNSVCRSSTQF